MTPVLIGRARGSLESILLVGDSEVGFSAAERRKAKERGEEKKRRGKEARAVRGRSLLV
jgi:hypothetical protein